MGIKKGLSCLLWSFYVKLVCALAIVICCLTEATAIFYDFAVSAREALRVPVESRLFMMRYY